MDPFIDAEADELVRQILEKTDQPLAKRDEKGSLTKLNPPLASHSKRSLSKRQFGPKRP
jgi:hypothetical protein